MKDNSSYITFCYVIQVVRFISKVTLLASGGAGHIYPTTTNPPVLQGLSLLVSSNLVDFFKDLSLHVFLF
jgi:aspartate oxidase